VLGLAVSPINEFHFASALRHGLVKINKRPCRFDNDTGG
jgi:hypothetical protein